MDVSQAGTSVYERSLSERCGWRHNWELSVLNDNDTDEITKSINGKRQVQDQSIGGLQD